MIVSLTILMLLLAVFGAGVGQPTGAQQKSGRPSASVSGSSLVTTDDAGVAASRLFSF
jgi:hypothetical protein